MENLTTYGFLILLLVAVIVMFFVLKNYRNKKGMFMETSNRRLMDLKRIEQSRIELERRNRPYFKEMHAQLVEIVLRDKLKSGYYTRLKSKKAIESYAASTLLDWHMMPVYGDEFGWGGMTDKENAERMFALWLKEFRFFNDCGDLYGLMNEGTVLLKWLKEDGKSIQWKKEKWLDDYTLDELVAWGSDDTYNYYKHVTRFLDGSNMSGVFTILLDHAPDLCWGSGRGTPWNYVEDRMKPYMDEIVHKTFNQFVVRSCKIKDSAVKPVQVSQYIRQYITPETVAPRWLKEKHDIPKHDFDLDI